MDVAASEFFKDGKYDLDFKNEQSDPATYLTPDALQTLYLDWVKEFPIVSIEDPFDQDDWDSWTTMTAATPIQIVGDDLTVTNPVRLVNHLLTFTIFIERIWKIEINFDWKLQNQDSSWEESLQLFVVESEPDW